MRSRRDVQSHRHAADVRRARGDCGAAPQREVAAMRGVVVRVHVQCPPRRPQAVAVRPGHYRVWSY